MTVEIADALMEYLGAQGALVWVEAEHMCMNMRGVRKPGTATVTTAARGLFATDKDLKNEAYKLMGHQWLAIRGEESGSITDQGLRGIRLSRCFSSRKELGQRFVLDPWVDYEMTRAARTGDLEASIHYGILAEQLTEWMQAEKIDLIETVAFQLVQKIFESYVSCRKVRLELKKPWLLFPCHSRLVR